MKQENLIKMLSAIHNENQIMLVLMSTLYSADDRKKILERVDKCEQLFAEGIIGEMPSTTIS